MPESTTAEIIAFPLRADAPSPADTSGQSMAQKVLGQTPVPAAVPGAAEDRLARALTGLNNAVITQRAAMAAWRSALGDLRTVTGRLGASLRSYNDSLGNLDARVNRLRTEAVKLETWADDVLTKKG